jgi:hypothetical protein
MRVDAMTILNKYGFLSIWVHPLDISECIVNDASLNTAKSYKAHFMADLQAQLQQLTSEGLNVIELSNFMDGTLIANVNIYTRKVVLVGRAIGFLMGTVMLDFSSLVVGGLHLAARRFSLRRQVTSEGFLDCSIDYQQSALNLQG